MGGFIVLHSYNNKREVAIKAKDINFIERGIDHNNVEFTKISFFDNRLTAKVEEPVSEVLNMMYKRGIR